MDIACLLVKDGICCYYKLIHVGFVEVKDVTPRLSDSFVLDR